jgi:hypothetical protein
MIQDDQVRQTLEVIQNKVKEVFSSDPLLESITVTLSWSTGNAERPFGLMIGRDGEVSSVSNLIRTSQQTSKMLMYQAAEVNKMFDAADSIAMDLAKKIKELRDNTHDLVTPNSTDMP